MSFSCDPEEVIFNFKELAVAAATGVGYGIDAEGEGFLVVVIDRGGGWYVVASHKRISTTDNLAIG